MDFMFSTDNLAFLTTLSDFDLFTHARDVAGGSTTFSSIVDNTVFLPIPPLQLAIITSCIIFLSFFLNSFVFRFYWVQGKVLYVEKSVIIILFKFESLVWGSRAFGLPLSSHYVRSDRWTHHSSRGLSERFIIRAQDG